MGLAQGAKFLTIIAILVFVTRVAGSSSEIKCPETQSSNISMPAERDHVGYCGHFAFRTLLSHFICAHNKSQCFTPSILDLIGSNIMWTADRRFRLRPQTMGKAIANNQFKMIDERCLPFESFFSLSKQNGQAQSFEENFNERARKTIEQSLSGEEMALLCSANKRSPDNPISDGCMEYKATPLPTRDSQGWNALVDSIVKNSTTRLSNTSNEVNVLGLGFPHLRFLNQMPFSATAISQI